MRQPGVVVSCVEACTKEVDCAGAIISNLRPHSVYKMNRVVGDGFCSCTF